ncbi:MAG: hypothetical protein J0L75_20630 [Spirochaetes bacterium]|nr:hypothetical protein [Spirochaetota bacterium]
MENQEESNRSLTAYSPYFASRVRALLALARDLGADLDASFGAGDREREVARERVSKFLWLWIFGAYEVTRTMRQSQGCFAKRVMGELSDLKALLEPIRVADAKMEALRHDRKERPLPLAADRATENWDEAARDILMGDPAHPVSGRKALIRFQRVMGGIGAGEILMSHEAFARAK